MCFTFSIFVFFVMWQVFLKLKSSSDFSYQDLPIGDFVFRAVFAGEVAFSDSIFLFLGTLVFSSSSFASSG